jgi:hypothetical protein
MFDRAFPVKIAVIILKTAMISSLILMVLGLALSYAGFSYSAEVLHAAAALILFAPIAVVIALSAVFIGGRQYVMAAAGVLLFLLLLSGILIET